MRLIVSISFIILVVLICSCNTVTRAPDKSSNEQKEIKDDSGSLNIANDFVTKIKLTKRDSILGRMSVRDACIYLARRYYDEITDTRFIKSIDAGFESTAMIGGYGKVIVSEINIKGKDIASTTPPRCYLLYNKEKGEAFIFDFNRFFLIKGKLSDTANMIGGIVITKGVGYFLVYSFEDTSFVKIFDSGLDVEDNIVAVPVYLNDGGCIKYSNDYLGFKNNDINNDGRLDFSFTGTVLYYCRPNEYGIDISKRKPIRQTEIKINYILEGPVSKPGWVLSDSVKIKKLLDID